MSSLSRFAVSALAVAGTAYAACSASSTTTVQNQGDAAAFTSCSTFSGSIAIATGTTEDISLDGIKKLDGNLVASEIPELSNIGAGSMEEITGTFRLNDIRDLSGVNFPKLKKVKALEFVALPNIDVLGFDAEIEQAETIRIDNTRLSTLKGINLETVKQVDIVNNGQIREVSMQLTNVTGLLTIGLNNPDVNITLGNLTQSANLTFINCSSVSLPKLEQTKGQLSLRGNVFESFSAPSLTQIGGALSIVSNTEMTNLSFPALTTITENIQIANNTKLHKLDGLPKLKTIGASLDVNGNFSEIAMPNLNTVNGAFNLQSTGDVQKTCDDDFKPLKEADRIRGRYLCVGKVVNPGGEGSTPTVAGGNGAKPTGAASAVNVGGNALLAGLAAAMFL